jgi:hypothetical protein
MRVLPFVELKDGGLPGNPQENGIKLHAARVFVNRSMAPKKGPEVSDGPERKFSG